METNIDENTHMVYSDDESTTALGKRQPATPGMMYLLVLIFELLCLLAIVLITYWGQEYMGGYGWDGTGKMFNWHPVAMVIGMIVLYGNAAISYRLFRTQPKFAIKLLHAALHGLALIFIIVGLVAVFGFHNHNNIANLYSLHSWVGILTVVLFSCQYVLGFSAFLFPKFGDDLRALALKYHQFFGRSILYLAVIASVSGLTEKMLFSASKYKWADFPAAGNIANVIGLTLIAIAVLVNYIVYEPDYKRPEQYEQIR